MARKAKTDREIQKGRIRLSKVKSVEADFSANADVSVATMNAAITDAEGILDNYNQTLSSLDAQSNQYDLAIKKVNDIGERLLDAVGLKYGKDSDQYEMAGGTRKSEYKKPVKKDKS